MRHVHLSSTGGVCSDLLLSRLPALQPPVQRRMMLLRILLLAVGVTVGVDRVCADPYYELVRKIENPAGPIDGSGDEFGISLAQVGENFVVGAYRDDTGALNAGAAYVFDREGTLLTTIHNPTPGIDDWFGFKVASVEGRIIIAAENDGTVGPDTGAVYLYDQDGNLLQTIANPRPEFDDDFGQQVVGVGDQVLVTAWRDDTFGLNAGIAYLFDQDGNVLQEFSSPDLDDFRFGRSAVSLGGDRVVIGAWNTVAGQNSGSVYIFDVDGKLLGSYVNPDPGDGDLFGGQLAVVGDSYVAIGAYEDDTTGVTAGTVYLFDVNGDLSQTILNPTPEVQDWFGRTMGGFGDDRFLIGAIFDDTAGLNAGAAYLYDDSGRLLQTFLPPDPSTNGHFGRAFSTLGELLLISSNFDGGFTGPGAVYVYAPLPPLQGDYNADQLVDQADLDFVLLNWGSDASDRPDDWVRNLPHAVIDQQELDEVLLNWGRTTLASMGAAGVPEPGSCLMALVLAGVLLVRAAFGNPFHKPR